MDRHVSRSWVVSVALCVAVAGCADEPSQPEADPGTLNTSAPATGTEGPGPDTGGGDGKAVLLPKIPIGGGADSSADPEHPANQCVDINWIVDQEAAQIPAGVEVTITGVTFEPAIFALSQAGCSAENPPCVGYIFTTSNQVCDLAIEPLGIPADPSGGNPTMSAAGEVFCNDAESPACAAFIDAVATEQNVSIDLNFPELEDSTDPEVSTGTGESSDPVGTTEPTEDAATDGGTIVTVTTDEGDSGS